MLVIRRAGIGIGYNGRKDVRALLKQSNYPLGTMKKVRYEHKKGTVDLCQQARHFAQALRFDFLYQQHDEL